MMCIACEQDFTWLAYLESRALNEPVERVTARKQFAPFSDRPQLPSTEQSEPKSTEKSKFSCDEPPNG